MSESITESVAERAGGNCEYCRLPQELMLEPFQVDHILARQHGGQTEFDNLAWACMACNNRKGPNVAGVEHDGSAQRIVRLFHPRRDNWEDHFQWRGAVLEGRTPTGRVTVSVLGINLPHRVALRQALLDEGVFPT